MYYGIAVALAVHGGLLYGDIGAVAPPVYTVRHAPSSIEISLVATKPVPKEVVKEREVVVTKPLPHTPQKKNEERPVKITKPLQKVKPEKVKEDTPEKEPVDRPVQEATPLLNTQQGALIEPKPLSFYNASPIYPRVARERGYEGTVILRVTVLPSGKPGSIEVKESSGYVVLDNAALRAVKKWQFTPAKKDDIALESSVDIPVVFVLRNHLK
ncbi:MAG: energy transducer TonB [Candidatus Omnitrophota bacterium]